LPWLAIEALTRLEREAQLARNFKGSPPPLAAAARLERVLINLAGECRSQNFCFSPDSDRFADIPKALLRAFPHSLGQKQTSPLAFIASTPGSRRWVKIRPSAQIVERGHSKK
jgi:hypothetical protein